MLQENKKNKEMLKNDKKQAILNPEGYKAIEDKIKARDDELNADEKKFRTAVKENEDFVNTKGRQIGILLRQLHTGEKNMVDSTLTKRTYVESGCDSPSRSNKRPSTD